MLLHVELIGCLALVCTALALRFDSSSGAGRGKKNRAGYYLEMGKESSEGHDKESFRDSGRKGEDFRELMKADSEEEGGNSKKHLDELERFQKHFKGRQSHKGGKFGEKKGHKKGHKTKGYHNKFYKDEYIKEHKFYDDYHKSGEFSKYGDARSASADADGGSKKGLGYRASSSRSEHGSKGDTEKGHKVLEDAGHKASEGRERSHGRFNEDGKKGETRKGSRYVYS